MWPLTWSLDRLNTSVEPESSSLCSFCKYNDLFNSVLELKCNVSSDAAHVACNPSEKVIWSVCGLLRSKISFASGLGNVLICKRTGTESFGSKDSIYGLWGYLEVKFHASQAVVMAGYEWLSLLLRQLWAPRKNPHGSHWISSKVWYSDIFSNVAKMKIMPRLNPPFPARVRLLYRIILSRTHFLGIVSCMHVDLTLTNVSDKILYSVKLCNLNYIHFPTPLRTVMWIWRLYVRYKCFGVSITHFPPTRIILN